ncbi:hypothetical protein E4U53_004465, partial [Claviceps sorghi]
MNDAPVKDVKYHVEVATYWCLHRNPDCFNVWSTRQTASSANAASPATTFACRVRASGVLGALNAFNVPCSMFIPDPVEVDLSLSLYHPA